MSPFYHLYKRKYTDIDVESQYKIEFLRQYS